MVTFNTKVAYIIYLSKIYMSGSTLSLLAAPSYLSLSSCLSVYIHYLSLYLYHNVLGLEQVYSFDSDRDKLVSQSVSQSVRRRPVVGGRGWEGGRGRVSGVVEFYMGSLGLC